VGSPDNKRGYAAAGVLAVVGVLFLGRGVVPHGPEPNYAGPPEIRHIPDGDALPAATPVKVDIDDAGVHAPLMRLGKNKDGTVQVPPFSKPKYAGWYRYGPSPGERGNAVILGHLDDEHTAAAFYKLKTARRFEDIEVTRADGTTAVFEIDAVQKVPKSRFPVSLVYGAVRYAGLRLVTCGGTFDYREHSYRDNLIVYAHLTDSRRSA
jgi:hypothetical protein